MGLSRDPINEEPHMHSGFRLGDARSLISHGTSIQHSQIIVQYIPNIQV